MDFVINRMSVFVKLVGLVLNATHVYRHKDVSMVTANAPVNVDVIQAGQALFVIGVSTHFKNMLHL